MHLLMRSVLACGGMCVSSVALAQPPAVPDHCKEVASVPADAQTMRPATAAKISLANCGAEARFAELKLAPDDASIQALANAAKPSLDLYDEVIRANDATLALIATRARADLLIGMAIRMRNAIPPITMQTVGQPLADHVRAHAEIEPKIKPWLDQANGQ
jgi:hypothetical protein